MAADRQQHGCCPLLLLLGEGLDHNLLLPQLQQENLQVWSRDWLLSPKELHASLAPESWSCCSQQAHQGGVHSLPWALVSNTGPHRAQLRFKAFSCCCLTSGWLFMPSALQLTIDGYRCYYACRAHDAGPTLPEAFRCPADMSSCFSKLVHMS